MALAFFLLGVIVWLFRAHHVSDPVFEFLLFQRGMGPVLWLVSLMWGFLHGGGALCPPRVAGNYRDFLDPRALLAGKWFDPHGGPRHPRRGGRGHHHHPPGPGRISGAAGWLNNAGHKDSPCRCLRSPRVTLMLSSTLNFGSVFNSAIVVALSRRSLLLFLVLVHGHQALRWMAAVSFVLLFAVAYHPLSRGRIVVETGTGEFSLPWNPEVGCWHWCCWDCLRLHGLVAVIFCLFVRLDADGFSRDLGFFGLVRPGLLDRHRHATAGAGPGLLPRPWAASRCSAWAAAARRRVI